MDTYRVITLLVSCLIATASLAATGRVSAPLSVARLAVYTPPPEYPADAIKRRIIGSGVFLLRVDIPSGRVTQVIVGLTTRAPLLDAAAAKALRQWRFKPGAMPYRKITSVSMSPPQTREEALVKVPVTFM
jgi:protein TonB